MGASKADNWYIRCNCAIGPSTARGRQANRTMRIHLFHVQKHDGQQEYQEFEKMLRRDYKFEDPEVIVKVTREPEDSPYR